MKEGTQINGFTIVISVKSPRKIFMLSVSMPESVTIGRASRNRRIQLPATAISAAHTELFYIVNGLILSGPAPRQCPVAS